MQIPQLARAPRRLPFLLKLTLAFEGMMGNFTLGYCLVLSLICLVLTADTDPGLGLRQSRQLARNSQQVEGRIESVSGQPGADGTYDIGFSYELGSKTLQGTSYSERNNLRPGQTVTVLYDPQEPAVSKVQGTSLFKASFRVGQTALILGGAGLWVLVLVLRAAARKVYLFEQGALRELVYQGDRVDAGIRVNNKKVFNHSFVDETFTAIWEALDEKEPQIGEKCWALVDPGQPARPGEVVQARLENDGLGPDGNWRAYPSGTGYLLGVLAAAGLVLLSLARLLYPLLT